MKKILSLLLVICICLCAVGCNKVTDTNSSSLSSTITEIETETIYVDEQESSSNDTTTEESKVETTVSGTPSENTTPTPSTITSSVPSQESTPSSSEMPTSSEETSFNEQVLPEWTNDPIAKQVVSCWTFAYSAVPSFVYVITNQNELYCLSSFKPYSSGSYFKKIGSDFKFKTMFSLPNDYYDDSYRITAVTTDNKIVGIAETGEIVDRTEEVQEYLNENTIGNYYENFYFWIIQEYAHYENNNILSLDNQVLYSFPQGENILSVYRGCNNIIIQTTKGFYEITASMESEFADTEPKLIIKAKFISAQLDDLFIKEFFKEAGFHFGIEMEY